MRSPLVVDLDGTLIKTDLLIEAVLKQTKKGVYEIVKMALLLPKGKAEFKSCLADMVSVDVSVLPYNEQVIELLRKAKKENRRVVLATASNIIYAEKIAKYLDLFDDVLASEAVNLSSGKKRDKLVEEYGEKRFDYIGNSYADIPVWTAAEKAYVVDPEPGVLKKIEKYGNVEKVIRARPNIVLALLKAMRPHQWMKNLLIFIPLLATHHITTAVMVLQSLLAFILFSMSASSGYLINDLLDLENDRHHKRKRNRPLASGALPLTIGIIAAPLLFLSSVTVSSMLLSWKYTISLIVYYILTIVYSQYLKSQMGIDTIALAGLYTVRIIAGSYACGLVPTFWILAFSLFLFLSLAMVKRYAELLDARSKGKTEQTRGRGYFPADLEIIANLGSASGYLSVLVLALYIQDPRTLMMYRTHELIWLACPILLFWISRMWMITHRGQMHDDPVLFAIKDRVSLLTGVLFGAVFMLASFL